MKSIKKRFKQLLAELADTANELALLSADLSLLQEIQEIARKVLAASQTLSLRAAQLNKAEFVDEIADCEALALLEELIDNDAVSTLEDVFFAELENHADSRIGEFLQQLLEKIDKRYTKILENIQQLSSLLEEE